MKNFDILSPIALAAVLVVFGIIFVLRKRRKIGFSTATIGALIIGVAFGFLFSGHLTWVTPVGKIYTSVLSAIVAPLIIVSILSSVTSLGSVSKLKGIGVKSVAWLFATTLIGIVLAIALGLTFSVGKGAHLSIDGVDASAFQGVVTPFSQVLIDFFPRNVIEDISNERIIPMILFALLIAVSYVLVANDNAKKVKPFKDFIEATKLIVYKAVNFVIELTPYAVLALVATSTSSAVAKGSMLLSLAVLLVVSFVAFVIDLWGVNYVLLSVFANINPIRFFKKIVPAQVVAFSTQSSVGTLPVSTKILTDRIGVGEEVADFTTPLGTTIGMPGCAGIWPTLVAIYGINGLGIHYGVKDYLIMIVISLFVSLGVAGVPGTATITTASVLTALGLPLELIVLTIPITAIADTGRTATNVTGAMVAATIVAHEEKDLDLAIFAADQTQFSTTISEDDNESEIVYADELLEEHQYGVPLGAGCSLDKGH